MADIETKDSFATSVLIDQQSMKELEEMFLAFCATHLLRFTGEKKTSEAQNVSARLHILQTMNALKMEICSSSSGDKPVPGRLIVITVDPGDDEHIMRLGAHIIQNSSIKLAYDFWVSQGRPISATVT